MSYVKTIGGKKKYYVTVSPFTTQHGKKAIRMKGDTIPSSNKGFKYFNDDDNEIADYSAYTFEYRQNEYSIEEDIIDMPKGSDAPLPPSSLDRLSSRVSALSSQVNTITPYKASKTAYIGDTTCEFDYFVKGNISAWLDTNDSQIQCEYEIEDNKLIVKFDELEEVAVVNISIQ